MIDLNRCQSFTDIIHGNVLYSGLESEVIDSPLFNRLHKILQNSLVYLTYPSNKVKRFEHSLGTMHLAGKIIYQSFCNTPIKVNNELLVELKNDLDKWISSLHAPSYSYLPLEEFRKDIGAFHRLFEMEIPACKLYSQSIPETIDEKLQYLYIILYQGIRISALLHDAGHLPYSHVMEYVISNLFLRVSRKKEEGLALFEYEKDFLKTLTPLLNDNGKIEALHERIGKKIVSIIEDGIVENLSEVRKEYIFIPIIFHVAKEILSSTPSQNNIYSDLHKIIDSPVDADRLDYCSRDLVCSGVESDIINYERLINSYGIAKIRLSVDAGDRERFLFCASVKRIYEIELLMQKRWKIYTLINFHHNVHKHEILMEECIVSIAEAQLQKEPDSNSQSEKIDYSIAWIWKMCNLIDDEQDTNTLQINLLQLDDGWLDSALRHYLTETYENPFSEKKNQNDVSWYRLYEQISGRNCYRSVLKRANDFLEFDKQYHSAFITNEGFAELVDLATRYQQAIIRIWCKSGSGVGSSKIALEVKPSVKSCEEFDASKEGFAAFLSQIADPKHKVPKGFMFTVMSKKIANFFSSENEDAYLTLIEEEMRDKLADLNLQDIIIRFVKYKTGYDEVCSPQYVIRSGRDQMPEPLLLSQLSNQENRIVAEMDVMPPFHVFVLPKYNQSFDGKRVLEALAKCAACCAIKVFTENLSKSVTKQP